MKSVHIEVEAKLESLLNTATSAIARQSTNQFQPCIFRKTAGLALEEAQDLLEKHEDLPLYAAWKSLVVTRWMEIGA